MARCGGGSGGCSGGCGSRVHPRPGLDFTTVTASDTARTQVAATSRTGLILGGSVTRKVGGLGTEDHVILAFWRAAASESGDFIDRFEVCLETTGAEAGQGSFAFEIPPEWSHPTLRAFWVTVKNKTSVDEDYRVDFDLLALEP